MVVDTLGHLLTLTVTPAGEQERAQVGVLLTEVQAVTSGQVELAYVDRGYTVEILAMAAAEQGVTLEVVKVPRRSAVSSCCRASGSWSEALRGSPNACGSPATSNDYRRRWRACTTLPSPDSCSPKL
jgi:hypothetical protein